MRILAHRGLWKSEQEKNTKIAFERAFEKGYGIETDIRDHEGNLVISHNPVCSDCLSLEELLELWEKYEKPLLALNIKADGLYLLLENIFKRFQLKENNYFFFDASVPEQYIYLERGYNIFSRSSEFETQIAFWNESKGIWLDQFTESGHIEKQVNSLLLSGKWISVVSPELHKRDYTGIWEYLNKYKLYNNLILCTDIPEKAEEYFK